MLSEVLFPKFLVRPSGPLYVDPRLSIPKQWRDVYHYGDDGERTGWTRYQRGEMQDFSADGKLIVRGNEDKGTPDESVRVKYLFDPKSKQLKMETVEAAPVAKKEGEPGNAKPEEESTEAQ